MTDVYSPVAFSNLRRRYVQMTSVICALSFVMTQISLLSWCQPPQMNGSQCATYHNHTIISLTIGALTTVLILIIPTPFIPTPRHYLLAILLITGISTLVVGILARIYILTRPTSRTYLFYYTYEITLLIVFANLPFLTSLVVSTTPARIRDFGRNISLSRERVHMPLSSWPRSSRISVQDIWSPPLRSSPFGSTITVTSGEAKRKDWTTSAPNTRPASINNSCNIGRQPNDERGWPLP